MAFLSGGGECNRQAQIQSHTCQADNTECARVPRLSELCEAFVSLLFSETEAALNYLITRRSSSILANFSPI